MSYYIGLCGTIGSGCSYVSSIIKTEANFMRVSLSELLRNLYKQKNQTDVEPNRPQLQDFGNILRQENPYFLAEEALKHIQQYEDKNKNHVNWVIDSIRNPFEVQFFRKNLVNFYLVGVYADIDIRWQRVENKYRKDRTAFQRDQERDQVEDILYGQRTRDCFLKSDIILNNNRYIPDDEDKKNEDFFKTKIHNYINLITSDSHRISPTEMETHMALTYAISQKSKCLKRKVGAILVEGEFGNVVCAGFNEVPYSSDPCIEKHNRCYRDKLKEDMEASSDIEDVTMRRNEYSKIWTKIKLLDYCRSLHAEENAILALSKLGSNVNFHNTIMYITAFPCNLCSKKIAQLGIRKIIYFEPYPMKEAVNILNEHGVVQEPFEGVTFRSYFRIYEREVED